MCYLHFYELCWQILELGWLSPNNCQTWIRVANKIRLVSQAATVVLLSELPDGRSFLVDSAFRVASAYISILILRIWRLPSYKLIINWRGQLRIPKVISHNVRLHLALKSFYCALIHFIIHLNYLVASVRCFQRKSFQMITHRHNILCSLHDYAPVKTIFFWTNLVGWRYSANLHFLSKNKILFSSLYLNIHFRVSLSHSPHSFVSFCCPHFSSNFLKNAPPYSPSSSFF